MLNANPQLFCRLSDKGRYESLGQPALPQEPSGASNVSATLPSVVEASPPVTGADDVARSVGSVRQQAVYLSPVQTLAAGTEAEPRASVQSVPTSLGNSDNPTSRKPSLEPARNTDPPSTAPEGNNVADTSSGKTTQVMYTDFQYTTLPN